MTFHAACCRILRRNIDRLGYDSSFTIYDTADSEWVMKDIIKDMGLDDKTFPARLVLSVISKEKDKMVTPEMLLEVLPEVRVADSVLRPLREGEKAVSPGMMYKHYAPGGMLSLVKGRQEKVEKCCRSLYNQAVEAGKTARILAFEEHLPAYEGMQAISIGRLSEPETVSHRLFAVLRELDEAGIDVMFSEVLPAEGLGLAIMNRLSRAAGFRVIEADQED